MFLTSALIVGGALYTGAKVYRKLKKETSLGAVLAKKDLTNKDHPFRTAMASGQAALVKAIPASLQPLFNDSRSPQLQDIPRHEDELTEQELNHFLKVATVAIGLSIAGTSIYAPLGLLSLPFMAYTFIPVFYSAYESIFKKRRFQVGIIDAIALLGVLAAGYWLIATVGCWLYFIAEKLRIKTAYQSRQHMVNLLDQQQQFVWQRVDGVELRTPLEALQVGDVIVVNVGEMIPVDGQIVDGMACIDQQVLTGETQLVEKTVGEPVYAATVVLAGHISIRVEKSGADTLAAQIGDILHRNVDSKPACQTRAEAISERAALPMFGVCTLALATLGPTSAVAVLCSNFAENLRIAAPISLLNFLNLTSRRGILIKAGCYLEQLGEVDTIVFDQTGAWLLGEPYVRRVSPYASMTETALLTYAAAAAYKPSFPGAKAIIQAAEEQHLALPDIDETLCEVDDGITIRLDQQVIQVGSARFMALQGITIPEDIQTLQAKSHAQGHCLVYVALDDCLGGVIELQPTIGPKTKAMIRQLKQRNLSIYVISGAHDTSTQELATALGINHYVAGVLSEDKAKLVEQLHQEGRSVCFVGDGISDAIAMQKAQASISVRGASTMVTDPAQIIMVDQSLDHLSTLFDLSHYFNTNMKTTFATTFGLGLAGIGGIFLLHFGILQAIILNIVGLGVGVTSAMLPAFNRQFETEGKKP